MEKRKLFFFILLVFTFKMFFFLRVIQNPELAVSFGDPLEYFNLAKGLVYDQVYNSSTRPILYPLIYSVYVLIFGKIAPVALVFTQYILSILIGWVIYQIIYTFTNDKRKALLGFSFYALNPVITLYESSTYSETFFIFFVAIGTLYYVRRRSALSGLFFGLSILVRPAGLILVCIPLLFLFIDKNLTHKKERIKEFMFMLLAVAVIVAPWAARNYIKYDRIFVSNISEFSFGLYQINYIYADIKHIDIVQARKEWLAHVFNEGKFHTKYAPPDISKMDRLSAYWEYQQYPDITSFAFKEALKIYIAHPYSALKFAATGLTLAYINPALWPMSEFWGIEIDNKVRGKLFDSFLSLKFHDISMTTDVLPFLNRSLVFSTVYGVINLILLVLIIKNVLNRKVSVLMLLMFLLSWFIAGFAGIGGSRYFVNGYIFFIIAALGCKDSLRVSRKLPQ